MAKDQLISVCGAGGFIGGALVADLRAQGYTRIRAVDQKPFEHWYQRFDDVENLVLDLQEKDACVKAAHGAHTLYNLAADMGGMGFIENNKALCMLSVLINTHLCMAARDAGVERFFYASSACVYNGDKQKEFDVPALKEEDAYPALPEDGYGWEKLFSERMARHFREDFGIATRIARYHNVYGPNGTWDGQIPTDQLWLYLNTIEIAHNHDSMGDPGAWGELRWISESPHHQGWDVWLGCDRECKLQSCFSLISL